jgi:predicted enzyme related to lactoylglutathione lyase
MSTHNQIDVIEFPAASPAELRATGAFFTSVFGWTFTGYGDEYSDTRDSGVVSGINASRPGERSGMPLAVVYVEDLDAAKAAVVAAGGAVLGDIYAFPGGRRFHFTEPSGNELAIWSDR